MIKLTDSEPVKFLVMVLLSKGEDVNQYIKILEEYFGKIDFVSEQFPFDVTNYYEKEMGGELNRYIISFENLLRPHEITEKKIKTVEIERRFANNENRTINIDPGYMDYHKLVLASMKYGAQKIGIANGVYADTVLLFENKEFRPLPWSFPDFRTGRYSNALKRIRLLYRKKC